MWPVERRESRDDGNDGQRHDDADEDSNRLLETQHLRPTRLLFASL